MSKNEYKNPLHCIDNDGVKYICPECNQPVNYLYNSIECDCGQKLSWATTSPVPKTSTSVPKINECVSGTSMQLMELTNYIGKRIKDSILEKSVHGIIDGNDMCRKYNYKDTIQVTGTYIDYDDIAIIVNDVCKEVCDSIKRIDTNNKMGEK